MIRHPSFLIIRPDAWTNLACRLDCLHERTARIRRSARRSAALSAHDGHLLLPLGVHRALGARTAAVRALYDVPCGDLGRMPARSGWRGALRIAPRRSRARAAWCGASADECSGRPRRQAVRSAARSRQQPLRASSSWRRRRADHDDLRARALRSPRRATADRNAAEADPRRHVAVARNGMDTEHVALHRSRSAAVERGWRNGHHAARGYPRDSGRARVDRPRARRADGLARRVARPADRPRNRDDSSRPVEQLDSGGTGRQRRHVALGVFRALHATGR